MKKAANIISGSTLILIGVSAGSVSLSANVGYGLEQSLVMGMVCGLAETARIVIPLVAAFKGWSHWLKTVMIVCAVTSISVALANFANMNASQLLRVENANDDHGRAKAELDRLRAELDSIQVNGDVAALEDLVATQKDKASKEAGRGFCGPKCDAAEKAVAATLADLSKARRKADLEAKLALAQGKLDATKKVEVSGASVMISAFTGIKAEKISLGEGFFWGLISIAVVEVLVYLGIPGFHFLLIGFGRVEEEAPAPAAQVVSLGQSRKERALQALVALIRSAPEGGIYGSGRSLAVQLKVSPSTFAEYLKEWEADGVIVIADISAHKKRFSLAA
jgi:hypothetical protein